MKEYPRELAGYGAHPPDPVALDETGVTDERVQNPTEESYEAAVRGAVEQFRSSPFFKRDPNSAYEQILDLAFVDSKGALAIISDKGIATTNWTINGL